jgi:hypothetical protein
MKMMLSALLLIAGLAGASAQNVIVINNGPERRVCPTPQNVSGWGARGPAVNVVTTTKFGNGVIIRDGGQTVTTTPFGNGTIIRTSRGNTTTVTPFGNGYITRSSGGQTTTLTPFGNGFITRGNGVQRCRDQGTVVVVPVSVRR